MCNCLIKAMTATRTVFYKGEHLKFLRILPLKQICDLFSVSLTIQIVPYTCKINVFFCVILDCSFSIFQNIYKNQHEISCGICVLFWNLSSNIYFIMQDDKRFICWLRVRYLTTVFWAGKKLFKCLLSIFLQYHFFEKILPEVS